MTGHLFQCEWANELGTVRRGIRGSRGWCSVRGQLEGFDILLSVRSDTSYNERVHTDLQ